MARTPVKAVLDDIVDRGQAQRDKASAAIEEALAAGKRGTEALTQIVRREVERQLRALGLRPAPAKKAPGKSIAKKTAATKSTAKKTAATKSTAKKSTAKKTAATSVSRPPTEANKSTAKKTTATKPAKKTAAKKAATAG